MGCVFRLQNSPYFCVCKYARAVKQKVWNEAENRARDWGETVFFLSVFFLSREARALRAPKTLTPRFIDFFIDFEKKTRLFCSLLRFKPFHANRELFIEKFTVGVRVLNDRVDSF